MIYDNMRETICLKYLIALIFFVFSINGFSQNFSENKISKNSFIAELSINKDLNLYSILYDRLIKSDGTLNFGMQTGLTFSTSIETGAKGYSVFYPIKGYFLVGRDSHKLESGFGVRILGFVFPDVNFGYRFKSKENGLMIRAGYNGIVLPGGLNNLVSLSIGYSF